MAGQPVIHERRETTPPHGDVIRLDVRRPSGRMPRSAVLVVHGFKGFKDWGFFPYLCERLAADGHWVASFNFSLNGTGPELVEFSDLDAFGRNTLSRELEDLHWMLDRLADGTWSGGEPPAATGVLGHSRGGGASIVAAAERNQARGDDGGALGDDGRTHGDDDRGRVDSLVTWAAISTFQRWTEEHARDWESRGVAYVTNARTGQEMPLYRTLRDDLLANEARLDVTAAAGRVRVPWLVLQGSEDSAVSADEARALAAAAGPAAALRILDGWGHTFGAVHPMEEPTPGLETAVDATLRHFRESLRAG